MSACCSNFGSHKCRCNCWPVDPRSPKEFINNIWHIDPVITAKMESTYHHYLDAKSKEIAIIVSESFINAKTEISEFLDQFPINLKPIKIELAKSIEKPFLQHLGTRNSKPWLTPTQKKTRNNQIDKRLKNRKARKK